VLVRLVASAVDRLALFVKRELLVNAVAVALNVSMQIVDVLSDRGSLGVVPGTIANAIAGIHRLIAGSGGAEISPPGPIAGPRCLGERLAVTIGSRQPPEIGSIPQTHAGDEETHSLRLLLGCSLPAHSIRRGQEQCRGKHG